MLCGGIHFPEGISCKFIYCFDNQHVFSSVLFLNFLLRYFFQEKKKILVPLENRNSLYSPALVSKVKSTKILISLEHSAGKVPIRSWMVRSSLGILMWNNYQLISRRPFGLYILNISRIQALKTFWLMIVYFFTLFFFLWRKTFTTLSVWCCW